MLVVQVFDGHSGSSAAEFARDQLLTYILQQSAFPEQLPAALVPLFDLLPVTFAYVMPVCGTVGLYLSCLVADTAKMSCQHADAPEW